MSNSPLVDVTILSPNYNYRSGQIRKITIHHMAAVWTVERCGESFADPDRQGSSNYGIDGYGRVGLYVPEDKRAWTSNSQSNDHQAVTIEVANDEYGGEWHVSDTALAKLIDLCTDICRRNGIDRLNYTGDSTGNLTRHNMFAATACPGPYLQSKFPYIADEVNKRLEEDKPMTAEEKQAFDDLTATVGRLAKSNENAYKKIAEANKENEKLSKRCSKAEERLKIYDDMGVYDNAASRWAYIDGNIPGWAKETLDKLTKRDENGKAVLVGDSTRNSYNLCEIMIRMWVTLDRLKLLDFALLMKKLLGNEWVERFTKFIKKFITKED